MRPLKVVFLSIEMLLRSLSELYQHTNKRGGLGILAGDFAAHANAMPVEWRAFVPLHHRPWFDPSISLDYHAGADSLFLQKEEEFSLSLAEKSYRIKQWRIAQGKEIVTGIECPEGIQILYDEDRFQRLKGETIFGKAVYSLLKKEHFIPDVVWLNEGHTAPALWFLKEDPDFRHTKVLFTDHSPREETKERHYYYDTRAIEMPDQIQPIFIRNGVLDLSWGAMILSDMINCVSPEHGETTKDRYPYFATKITQVTNGTDLFFWRHPLMNHLAEVSGLSDEMLTEAHAEIQREWTAFLRQEYNVALDDDGPLACAIRRFTSYKNMGMIGSMVPVLCAKRGTLVATPFGILEGLGFRMLVAGVGVREWEEMFTRFHHQFPGRFVYLPYDTLRLLRFGAQASDVWIATPEKKEEACGGGHERAALNGVPSIATATGGMRENIREFSQDTKTGNGFLIEPYHPLTFYQKAAVFSDLWYQWHEHKTGAYPALVRNAFETSSALDIRSTLRNGYYPLFQKLANGHF
jgi:glycogen synthase